MEFHGDVGNSKLYKSLKPVVASSYMSLADDFLGLKIGKNSAKFNSGVKLSHHRRCFMILLCYIATFHDLAVRTTRCDDLALWLKVDANFFKTLRGISRYAHTLREIKYVPYVRLNPVISFFTRDEFYNFSIKIKGAVIGENKELEGRLLKDMCREYLRFVSSGAWREANKVFYKNCSDKQKRLLDFFRCQLTMHEKIYAVMCDLSIDVGSACFVHIEHLKEVKCLFIKYVKKHLARHKHIGYIWKLCFSVHCGFSYRVLFLFDCDSWNVDDGEHHIISTELKALWTRAVFELANDCHAGFTDVNDASTNVNSKAVGLITADEKVKIASLIINFTAMDMFVSINSQLIGRTFGRSEVKQIRDGNKICLAEMEYLVSKGYLLEGFV